MEKTNIFKKIFRIINKFLLIAFAKIIAVPLKFLGIKIIPPYDEIKNFQYHFSEETRRLILKPKKNNSFNKIFVDTSLNSSLLCNLGSEKYPTNKSPYHEGFRSGFTGFYNLLFSNLRDKKINFAEIGIEKNDSIKMWREFFSEATIHAFDIDEEKIENAKKHNLDRTFYHKINVAIENSIVDGFKRTECKFDVIIDDSTHDFEAQVRVVKNCNQFLKKNGILIIEDIYKHEKKHSESNYYNSLKDIKNLFSDVVFIETSHVNNYTGGWKNEKILLLIKN
tara:strand:- start:128 stop:967 length:840 start_codon:yes stop_codon:yes gene_type:complete